jgi:hypothetical protein
MAIDWPDDMLPILGGRAALSRRALRPCRCGETRFRIAERPDGSISVECPRCVRASGRAAGTIDVGGAKGATAK